MRTLFLKFFLLLAGNLTLSAQVFHHPFDEAPAGGSENVDFSATGVSGNCATFNGKSHFTLAELPFDQGSDWTISFWVKGEPQHRRMMIGGVDDFWNASGISSVNIVTSGNGGHEAIHTGGKTGGGNKRIGAGLALDGEWHHITYVKNGDVIQIYLDGEAAGGATIPQLFPAGHVLPLFAGGIPGSGYRYGFTGSLDEVLIFPLAVSAATARGLYEGSITTDHLNRHLQQAEIHQLNFDALGSLSLTELHVSPGFQGEPDGSKERPFRHPEQARDCIRAMKAAGRFPKGGITVWLHGGTYTRGETFSLRSADGGQDGAPVCYRAHPGETPVFTMEQPVPTVAWRRISEDVRDRLHPSVDPTQLYEIDIAELGMLPTSPLPDYHIDLAIYAGGARQPIAQWPDRKEILDSPLPGWTTCNGSRDSTSFFYGTGGDPQGDAEQANQIDADGTGRAVRWKQSIEAGNELWLRGFWRTPWIPEPIPIEDINIEEEWIKLARVPSGGMGSKYTSDRGDGWRRGSGAERWMAVNLLEEINQPGEWALDFQKQKVYFLPPGDLAEIGLTFTRGDAPCIAIEGASDISLEGLTVSGCNGIGISIDRARRVTVAGCTVRNSFDGIALTNSSHCTLDSNDIYDIGHRGLLVRQCGDRATLTSSQCLITNNHIHHTGLIKYAPIVSIFDVVGAEVTHNLIHDGPKSGITTAGINNCLFEYNELHNMALKEGDTGAFYGTLDWATYGNVYRYNFIHHTRRANGFYCDDGNSGHIHYHNILHNTICSLKFGGGHHNVGRNNLLVENDFQRIDDRGVSRNYRLGTRHESSLTRWNPHEEPWLSYGRRLVQEFGFEDELWSDILTKEWMPEWPNGSKMVDNVAVDSGPFRAPRYGRVEVDRNTVIETVEAAGFYDYAQMDLRTDNPDVLAKFPDLNQHWPLMGLRKTEHRPAVPTREEVGGLANRVETPDPWEEDRLLDESLAK